MSEYISPLLNALDSQDSSKFAEIAAELDASELALAMESVPESERLSMWRFIPAEDRLDVLLEMHGDTRLSIIRNLSQEELDVLFQRLAAEDLIELSDSLPDRIVDQALEKLDNKQKTFYLQCQEYNENQTGRWVNHEMLVLPQNARVHEALRLLRKPVANYTDVIYLVNRAGHFVGCVPIIALLQAQSHYVVAETKSEDYPSIIATTDIDEAAEMVQRSGLAALPVVSEEGVLLGRLDIGSALEIVQERADQIMMTAGGLIADEDLFAPVARSAQTRALWLGINLITALLASWFIRLFEGTLQQVVALAVLMPVVASMGGIAGSQTSTLIVRGLALGQIGRHNMKALFEKECRVGAINGAIWCVIVGIIAVWWFSDIGLGFVIAIAIIVNILCASAAGIVIPMMLDKLKIDPALSASVILTTVTDIIGFVAFLGLGALFLT